MDNIHGCKITESFFDEIPTDDGCSLMTKVNKFTLSNGWMEVDVIDYGATIVAIRVPGYDGTLVDVALGYDCIRGYMATNNSPYFGATIGRVTNRIAGGKITIDNVQHVLSRNEGENTTLHGGVIGFNRKMWKSCVDNEGVLMQLISPHLDQGFPGELNVKARFVLTKKNQLIVTYTAKPDRPTVVNMTNHTYFNMAGHNTGSEKLYEHNLMINANNFTPTDEELIPLGKLQDVIDSVLDFTTLKNLGEAIDGTGDFNGFDTNLCVNGLPFEKKLIAQLEHPPSGRRMIIYSDQPGVQLYTANCLFVKEGKGKDGAGYSKHGAVCLETQNYPNAVNEKRFPKSLVRPPKEYCHVVIYEFSTFEPPPPPPPPVLEEQSGDIDLQDNFASYPSQTETTPATTDTTIPETNSEKYQPENVSSEQIDSSECEASFIPDFTMGPKYVDDSLEYEPLSLIEPYTGCNMEEFYTELERCRNVYSSNKARFQLPSFICDSEAKSTNYNIISNVQVNKSRLNF